MGSIEAQFPAATSGPPRTRSLTETFTNVRSFLKGRKLPGGVRLSRDQASTGAPPHAEPRASAPQSSPARPSPALSPARHGAAAPVSPSPAASPARAARDGMPRTGSSLSTASQGSAASAGSHPGGDIKRVGSLEAVSSGNSSRVGKFQRVLAEPVVNLDALRELSWSGIPSSLRPLCWRLLLGYLPANSDRREVVVRRKRQEYQDMVPRFYEVPDAERTDEELATLRQIQVDTPRTTPGVAFVQHPLVVKALERVLFIRAIRYPASSYVQGINDLVTPFLLVFLGELMGGGGHAEWGARLDALEAGAMMNVEADTYWCLCGLLEGIQDNYTYAQPGIQRMVWGMKELVTRVEGPVAAHLESEGVEFLQFAFRWVNCLLVREVPFELAPRLWDTYLAEGTSFNAFVPYACASFLLTWGKELCGLEFQDIVMRLQSLPTSCWGEAELAMVLSRAYIWKNMFESARSHFNS